MKDWYVFHKTVRGHLHILKDIPCEDFSVSCEAEDGSYRIVAVADGHGDPACARSAYGSEAAARIAADCLKAFAEGLAEKPEAGEEAETEPAVSYGNQLRIPSYQRVLIKQLTDSILSRWYETVHQDLEENPIREEELSKCSEHYRAEYQAGRHLEHIYGTTLIAGLMTEEFLILLHQGDGRCDVFYEDGTVDQPIPWDDRCFENVTTSVCDEDAADAIRHCVIDLKEKPVAACYMGSDGVEDSYRDMEGTHSFYRELSCDLLEKSPEEFDAYLEETLPAFSRTGSGDDVSVAGMADREALALLAPRFRDLNRSYVLSEKVLACQTRLTSMERKHGILRRRADEAKKAWEASRQRSLRPEQGVLLMLEKLAEHHGEAAEEPEKEDPLKKAWEDAEAAFREYDETWQRIEAEKQEAEKEIAAIRGNQENRENG